MSKHTPPIVRNERDALLETVTRMTDKFMIALAFVWIGLMITDFVRGLSQPLAMLNYAIWAVFIADFTVKFAIAPKKTRFLKTHWLTLISLVLPAFRVLRIFQALRALRALSLVRILTSMNRGMGALVEAMGKRGVGYVIVLSILVLFGGAAGMYQFENPAQLSQQGISAAGFSGYSDAVWWTAMLMTTIGSQYWPVTMEGRLLCFMVSLFSLGVFGYITATLASFFVDKDANAVPGANAGEIAALREEISRLRTLLENGATGPAGR